MVRATAEQRRIALSYLARRLEMADDELGDDLSEVFLACRGNDARGVVIYRNYSSGDIEMLCAGEPGWVTAGVVKFALTYPFEALNCHRITCHAARKNRAMRNYLERMGFKLEGVKRKALDGHDLMIYGLLRKEAEKWA